MKKFFSFVAAVLFAGSVMADWSVIQFTADAAKGTLNDSVFAVNGFSLKLTDTDNKLQIDANPASFGSVESRDDYSYRLKTGGKSSSKNNLTLTLPEAGKVRIAVRTGSNSDATRTVVAVQGEDTLSNRVAQEADTIEGATSPRIYYYHEFEAEAGVVSITYPVNSVNFYAFAFEATPVTPAGTTCAEVYNMAKNDVVDLLNPVTVTFANGKNVWVKDETASMLIYFAANTTYVAGNVLSNIAGVVDVYNGIHEVKPSADQAAAISVAEGEAPEAEEVETVTADDVNKYIVMKGIEFEADTAFVEGSQKNIVMNGVTVRNQFKNGFAFEAGKSYDIYGVVTLYNNNPQVYFITAEEAAAEPIVIANLTYGMVFTEDFAEWGAVDVLVTNQPIVGEQIVGDGYIVAFDILPENANNITGTYSALAENFDLEYSGITQIAGTDTIDIELADGEVAFQLGQYSIEAKAAQLAMAAELVDVDGNVYIVGGTVVVYYDFLPEEQGVENVAAEQKKVIKKIEMGNVVIEKNGVRYNVNGAVVR